ncbi:PDZ domain (Also known as DHR or GLGF) [Nesidiocoris tenuis]|uniref:PDZ domain (Also known as DHR or GLGF) n=1 Tax=Nesidiocoris tenuis TaxID=355587 RepID=A0ABN7AIJ2_9HEMI|nr:PDZ domain (Also known as DHR or GLGF) [Nesidiocoris tenuis]
MDQKLVKYSPPRWNGRVGSSVPKWAHSLLSLDPSKDGRLHEGDQILAIDGQPLDSNISHQQAISILQKAQGLVELVVARSEDVVAHPISPSPSPSPSAVSDTSKAGSDMVLNTEWAQVEVIDLINDGSGLGFGIIGGRSTGVVVKTILPGGVADRDGRLQSGDHILQIGDVNLRGMGSEQNGYPQVTFNPTTPSIDYDGSYNLFRQDSDFEILERDPRLVVDVVPVTAALPLPLLTMDMLPLDTELPEMERFTVELKKDIHGLGITIAGYVCEKEELSGIFVKSISTGSAADICKKIQVNDRIVEVDGRSLQGYTNHDAVEVLRSTGGLVRLSLERYLRGPKFEQLQQAIANSELKPPTPSSPSAVSLPRFPVSADGESTEIEVEGESVTTVDSAYLIEASNPDVELDDVEQLIDTDYTGPLKPSVEEAIIAKWSKIMGSEVEIVVGQLKKFGEGGGLGISLEGTVDVEDGQEVRPHHYIRSILNEGPVGQNGKLRSGDELLEVNGHRLLGMNHIEVVTILKELPLAVRMVCARRTGDGPKLIDTSQDRAAFAARSLLGGSLQNLLPAMERLVKAKSDGSLASTTTPATEPSLSKLRSRSLEPITGLAMWSSEPHIIELVKGDRGLGFSILDYQDPMNPSETVIVIRSLVPGGVAQMDGRLIPGDRLLSVNSVALDNASLDQAVQALKGAQKGIVRIAVAKPLPIPDSVSNSQDVEALSQDTPTLDDHSMYSCSGSIHSEDGSELLLEGDFLEKDNERDGGYDDQVPLVSLPTSLEMEIFIQKGDKPLGVSLGSADDGMSGMVVTELTADGAVSDDGRISVGDFVTAINNESLRFVTQAQAESVLEKFEQLPSDVSLRFIQKKAAAEYLRTCPRRPIHHARQILLSRSPYIRSGSGGAGDLVAKIRSPITSPLEFESASDKESEYVDCDWLEDRSGAVSPNPTKPNVPVPKPVTVVRRLSASSYDVDNFLNDTGLRECPPSGESGADPIAEQPPDPPPPDLEPPPEGSPLPSPPPSPSPPLPPAPPCESAGQTLASPPAPAPDRTSLSASDDTLDVAKEDDAPQQRTRAAGPPIFARERSFESLSANRVLVKGFLELSKGTSEPILNRGESFKRIRAEMTVTNQSCGILVAQCWGPQRTVTVHREPKSSLGISIVGGKVDLYNSKPDCNSTAISGIFIKNVLPNSPAGITGQLKPGDRILEVDGTDVRQASHEQAVDIIRAAGNQVTFLVQSLIQWSPEGNSVSASSSVKDVSGGVKSELSISGSASPDLSPSSATPASPGSKDLSISKDLTETESKEISDIKTCSPKIEITTPEDRSLTESKKESVKYSSSEEDSEDDDEYRDMEGRTRTAAGVEISRASAGNVKRSKDEIANDPEKEDQFGYTTNKVKKKYGSLGSSVLMVELEKSSTSGLGISLAGHKDRNKMAVLICGLNPQGVANKAGILKVGDEILEVNGVILHGRCHLNASAIIKGLPGPIFKIIVHRKDDALDEISVKPLTQFPVSLQEETPEQRYSSFKGLRTVSIKKPGSVGRGKSPSHQVQGQSLGIMIIEGKHAEVGQGIFISDIQDGSAAHQAGLNVGDMILAVNKDTLVGSNYDQAAALLKKTEGVVTLVVCNPNRAKEDEKKTIETPTVVAGGSTPTALTPTKSSIAGTPKLAPPPGSLSPSPSGKLRMDDDLALSASIVAGTEITIDINKDKSGLGFSIIGGADTLLGSVIVQEVFPGGSAAKDGRLRAGDIILEMNGEDLRNALHSKAHAALHQTVPKIRMVVYRHSDKPELDVMELDLPKKSGKGLGLSIVARKDGPGVYIADIVSGSVASTDGRLMKDWPISSKEKVNKCKCSNGFA